MNDGPQQSSLPLAAHNNQSLFSDHYLNEILRRSETWRRALPQAEAFLAGLRELHGREQPQLPHYNESQLEAHWFEPIFKLLGYASWEPQATIPGWQGKIKKPDFVFFPGEAARQTAASQQNSASYAATALTLAEVKQWGVNLSKKTGTQPIFADQNPMYQIDTYLSLTGLSWGILSDGRRWRLLHKGSSRTLETYFELDLAEALDQPNENRATAAALYFWLFFNAAAFRPDDQGRIFLDDALSQSRAYAVALEADLRDNAYRALEHLIIGFFAGSGGRLDPHNPDDRARVYQNSLYLLYRLLFLFYGESRALLPINQPVYQANYSLQRLSGKIDTARNQLSSLPVSGRRYWDQLRELFRLISGVDPRLNADLGVPRYNGGLFDPAQHPFLEAHFVGDRALAHAIDYLATRRMIQPNGRTEYQRVDYRTLDVRQLGSIYEGLLEYKVVVAEEEMVTISQKGVETWVTLAQRGKAKSYGDRRQPGELYLTTDKGERKATGSYYTPDYIVEYIVAQTLGPLPEAARERAAGSPDQFIAEILRLNVLDPAMGSGHFLVEATNYLARVLATDAHAPTRPQGFSNPLGSDEDDLLYWKRRVVESCIYGVDKNPMAVELAKLSLWLKTAAADKPLSFLDHHLQCGDSLIGAWLADLERPPRPQGFLKPLGSEGLFDESAFTRDAGLAVGGVATIQRLPSDDIEDVYHKERTWREIQQTHIGRWRRLADLWVSGYFGNQMSAEEYRALADRLQGRHSLMSAEQTAVFLNHTAVTDNDYFHWELAFPEIFFDEYGRARGEAAGFDAVIGNPPYGTLFSEREIQLIRANYEYVEYRAESYVAFMESTIDLARKGGYVSLIVPDNWMYLDFTERLRDFLIRETIMSKLIALPSSVFPDATVDTSIYVLERLSIENDPNQATTIIAYDKKAIIDRIDETMAFVRQQTRLLDDASRIINPYLNTLEKKVIDQLKRNTQPLAAVTQINYGLKAYQRGKGKPPQTDRTMKERPFTASTQADSTFAPFLEGQSVSRYKNNWSSDNWIKWGEWLAEPRNLDLFQGPRLLFRKVVGERLIGTFTETIAFSNTLLYVIKVQPDSEFDPKALLAILNSQLIGFAFRKLFAIQESDTFPQILLDDFASLPVCNISFTTQSTQRDAVLTTAQTHHTNNDHAALLTLTAVELAAGRNDTVHDILAYLAGQMITGNQEKQTAVKRFWLDMQGVCDPAVYEALRGKGKQQASIHKGVAAARPYVSADSRGSLGLEASLEWNDTAAFSGFARLLVKINQMADLADVYERYAPQLSALAQRLAATDRLIDQIVYQLYALTPEEIAIVEG